MEARPGATTGTSPSRSRSATRARIARLCRASATSRPGTSRTFPIYLTPQYEGGSEVAGRSLPRDAQRLLRRREGRPRQTTQVDHGRHRPVWRPTGRRPHSPADVLARRSLPQGPRAAQAERNARRRRSSTSSPTTRSTPPAARCEARSTPTTPRLRTSSTCARRCAPLSATTRSGTAGHHPLWATELWWDSDPPDKVEGIPREKAGALARAGALHALEAGSEGGDQPPGPGLAV